MKTTNRTRRRCSGMTMGNMLIVMLLVFFAVMTVTQFSTSTVQNAFKGRDATMTVALSDAGVSEVAGRDEGSGVGLNRPDSLLDSARSQVENQWAAFIERF